jgi:16S rRNA (guanine1207-N2)-methyltransferase
MLAHAAAGVMDPGGRFLLYGAKDEGAGSAGGRIEEVFREVRTVATGGRCRLWLAASPRDPTVGSALDDWRLEFDPGLEALGTSWVSFPGVFAHGRLDGGTALLLDVMPGRADEGERVLDFGCGHGVLGASVEVRTPGARVSYLDVDAVALEAVRRNVPHARTLLGDGWTGAGEGSWDGVVSNPPWHAGKPETLRVVEDLVTGAARKLVPGGWLALVTQRRLPIGSLLAEHFVEVKVAGDHGAWRVWYAVRR